MATNEGISSTEPQIGSTSSQVPQRTCPMCKKSLHIHCKQCECGFVLPEKSKATGDSRKMSSRNLLQIIQKKVQQLGDNGYNVVVLVHKPNPLRDSFSKYSTDGLAKCFLDSPIMFNTWKAHCKNKKQTERGFPPSDKKNASGDSREISSRLLQTLQKKVQQLGDIGFNVAVMVHKPNPLPVRDFFTTYSTEGLATDYVGSSVITQSFCSFVTDNKGLDFESRQQSAQQKLPPGIEVELQPEDITCKPGEKAELFIVLKTSTTACTYQWKFKDKPIAEADSDYEGSTSDRLCVHNCLSKHKGAYKCVITDSSGRSVTSEEATISLRGEPIVITAVRKLLEGILQRTEVDFTVYGIDIQDLVDGTIEFTYEEIQFIMRGNSATKILSENLKDILHSRLEEERLYKQSMTEDHKISLCYTKILALGPGQVGKSTFLYRLIGLMKGNIETSDPNSIPQCSTGVTELHEAACIRYVSMTGALTDKQWQVFDENTGIQSQLEGLIALLIKQLQEQEQVVVRPKIPAPVEQSTFSEPQENTNDTGIHTVVISDDEDSTESDKALELERPETLQDSLRVIYELPVTTAPEPRKQNINNVIQEFEKLQIDSRLSLTQEKTTFHMLFNIADIGGQPAFLEMLPSLTIGPALYLVFMKLLEGLKTRYPTAFKCKDNRGTKLCQNYTYTSEEVIFTALSSIACFGNSDEEVEMYVANKADRKQTNSLALLVGTHTDKIEDPAKLSAIDDELKQHIKETEFYTEGLIHSQKFLRVNNYSAATEEIQEHRQLLEDILTVKFRQFNIPARWLMLSICLKLLAKNQGTHEVSFDDCVEIGKHFQMSREMVKIALQFLHKYIGLVMYFPNHEHLKKIVICDPQAVFTSISELVFKIYDPTNLQVTEAQHDHFVQTGCFSPQDVKPISENEQGQRKVLSIGTLIDLLVHLYIVAEVTSSDSSQARAKDEPKDNSVMQSLPGISQRPSKQREFFFPAVLQTAKQKALKSQIRRVHESDEQLPEPIYIRFKTGYMPLGFVCALSAKLLAEPKFQLIFTEGSKNITCKNMLKFRYEGKLDILMISGPKYCEFHVSSHVRTAEFWNEDCCPQIKKTICDAADSVVCSMKQGSLYKLSKGYELAFKCTRHQDEFGHEPLARLIYDPAALGQTLPKEIQCVKTTCNTSLPLTPEMRMWFGEAPDFVPLEVICCSRVLNRLAVTVEGSDKPFKFQWFKDRKRLTDSASYSGSTTAELVIEGTDSGLKGVYKCCVTDSKSVKVWSGEIEVDPFVLSLERKGLREKEIKKLIDYGCETIEDLEDLEVTDASLKEVGLKGLEITRYRKFHKKEFVCERPPLDKDLNSEQPSSPKRPKLDSHVAWTSSEILSDYVPAPKRPKIDSSATASPGYSKQGNIQVKPPSQDDALSRTDLGTVFEKLYPASVKWEYIGLKLSVCNDHLKSIEEKCRGDPDKCLKEMLAHLLQSGGHLTWRMVCDCLRCGTVARNDVAKDIEQWCTGSTQRPEAEH